MLRLEWASLREWLAVAGAAAVVLVGSSGLWKAIMSWFRPAPKGLFVGYIPTKPRHIPPFFQLAPVNSEDVVYDLGCGDGRLLIAAIEAGAGKAVGVELDPAMVRESVKNVEGKSLEHQISVLQGDVMDADLLEATVVLVYLLDSASRALRPKFEAELKAGTRVVMESFPVPGWKPEKTTEKDRNTFYLYTMPPDITDHA